MDGEPIGVNSGDLAAHDVLAAEEFAMPAPDPTIGHRPVVLPDDPSGIAEPHDVLAAEEFALPASVPHPHGPFAGPPGAGSHRRRAIFGVIALLVASWILSGRRRVRT